MASIVQNFLENGCIACICHNIGEMYGTKQIAVVRASNDFYTQDPTLHAIYISFVAYNSIFISELMKPDWDMFHVSKNKYFLPLITCLSSLGLD